MKNNHYLLRPLGLTLIALAIFFFVAALAGLPPVRATTPGATQASAPKPAPPNLKPQMSAMGRIAKLYNYWLSHGRPMTISGNVISFNGAGDGGDCEEDEEECEPQDPDVEGAVVPGGQAEYAIAVDSTGNHVVVGFNDTRGFALNPVSVSGYYYSDDGGATFTDGGQLPVPAAAQSTIGTTKYPQVFGDADIKYGGGSTFFYSSIEVINSGGAPAQTMCIHRSTDNGHTWQGPFEITAATCPTEAGVCPPTNRDSADKEFIDFNPATGRLIVAWSNFVAGGSGGVQELTSFSDNALTANPPTWSV
ncbi:MAG TPA: hypothetical protein VF511_00885, partial [Chthoniobacterales bacterium]